MNNKKISSEIVLENPWYKVRRDVIDHGGSRRGEYYVVQTPGAFVGIVAMDGDKNIYLIRQYRYPLRDYMWEIPGGQAGSEDPEKAALRELEEETGITTGHMRLINEQYTTESILEEKSYVFLATDLTFGERHLDKEEMITELKKFSPGEIISMVKRGELRDSVSVTSIIQTLLYLGYRVEKL